MTEKGLGERVARMEGILEERLLPGIERVEGKLDVALETMKEKGSRQAVAEAHSEIDKIQIALENKADKTEVDAIKAKVIWWSGASAVLAALAGWYGPKLLAVLAK